MVSPGSAFERRFLGGLLAGLGWVGPFVSYGDGYIFVHSMSPAEYTYKSNDIIVLIEKRPHSKIFGPYGAFFLACFVGPEVVLFMPL